jgi:hypothetical protein
MFEQNLSNISHRSNALMVAQKTLFTRSAMSVAKAKIDSVVGAAAL